MDVTSPKNRPATALCYVSSPEKLSVKTVAILQSNYVPWKGYFDIIGNVDEFIVLDDVQFTKNDWRNRNLIKTRKGLEWLTIPVRQEFLAQTIREIRIADSRWASRHFTTLSQAYSKCEFFLLYQERLKALYNEAATLLQLSDVNALFLKNLCSFIGIKSKISQSSDYELRGDRSSRLVSLCEQASANVYLSGPAAKSYLDVAAFQANGIEVRWMNYDDYPEYRQSFPPFAHGVSVLDLLFNTGPQCQKYMKSVST